jgi:NTE family protein
MSDSAPPRELPEHAGGRRAAVYGGGGLFGIGFIAGITEALVDAGADMASLPAVGTSAGSWAAAGLVLGIKFPDALQQMSDDIPRVPNPRAGRLRNIAAEIFGADTRCPTVNVVACSLPRFTRTLLSGADHPIADLIAASSAVPGMLAPHRVGDKRYVDGGVRSMASIDHGAPANKLLVILPLSGPMFGPAGRLIERRISRELAIWRKNNRAGEVFVLRPTEEIANLARRPDQLFDPYKAMRCYELAYKEGVALRSHWM